MPDIYTRKKRSEIMSLVRAHDTAPELVVRRILHHNGFRYRIHQKELPGKPDIVLRKYRVVIFVHGCFWHCHTCRRGLMPTANRAFWMAKLNRNAERDKQNRKKLKALKWNVITVWQCKTKSRELLGEWLKRQILRYEKK